jgi:hypothetical protein
MLKKISNTQLLNIVGGKFVRTGGSLVGVKYRDTWNDRDNSGDWNIGDTILVVFEKACVGGGSNETEMELSYEQAIEQGYNFSII